MPWGRGAAPSPKSPSRFFNFGCFTPIYANSLGKNSISISFCFCIVLSIYYISRFLIYPNAMGGRCCALLANPPPSFLNIISPQTVYCGVSLRRKMAGRDMLWPRPPIYPALSALCRVCPPCVRHVSVLCPPCAHSWPAQVARGLLWGRAVASWTKILSPQARRVSIACPLLWLRKFGLCKRALCLINCLGSMLVTFCTPIYAPLLLILEGYSKLQKCNCKNTI